MLAGLLSSLIGFIYNICEYDHHANTVFSFPKQRSFFLVVYNICEYVPDPNA